MNEKRNIVFTEQEDSRSTKIYKDKKHQEWRFIPKKEFDDLEIHLARGDLGRKKRSQNEEPVAILKKEECSEEVEVFAYARKLAFTEKVKGYMPCVDEENKTSYLRVIGKKISIYLIPLLLVLAMLGGIATWQLMNQGPKLDEAAIAYQMPNGLKNEDPSQIMLPGYTTMHMDAKTREVNAMLVNPEGNPCYFEYHIVLADSKEEIYSSDFLKPGTAISGFKVNQDLKPGSYEIEIRVETRQLSDPEKEMNNGVIDTVLEVE